MAYKSKSWIKKWTDEQIEKRRSLLESSGYKRRQELKDAGVDRLEQTRQTPEFNVPESPTKPTPFGGQPEKGLLDQTIEERQGTFWNQKEYDKELKESFEYNKTYPFYDNIEKMSGGMPDFGKTIKMETDKKPLEMVIKAKTPDGMEFTDQLNPLLEQLGIVDVKKKVYKYRNTTADKQFSGNDTGGYEIITTPREINVVGENSDNYYYVLNGALVSLSKKTVTEHKPSKEMLEQLWMESVNTIIEQVRGSTAEEEQGMLEEIRLYGTDNLTDDIEVLKRNGIEAHDGMTPVQIRKRAMIERKKEKPWRQRIGEAEGLGTTLDEITSPFGGQASERIGKAIPQVASGLGLPEGQQDIESPIPGVNQVADIMSYAMGLGAPIGGGLPQGAGSVGGTAYTVGQKAVSGIGQKIGGKLGAITGKLTSPAAQKILDRPIAGAIGRGATEGAASAPLVTAYEATAQDLGTKETLKRGAIEAGVGAVLGGVLGGAVKGAKIKSETKKVKSAADDIRKAKETATKAKEAAAKAEAKKAEKTKYSKSEFSKKYGLDEDLSGKSLAEKKKIETKAADKLLGDIGKRVSKKVGSTEPRKVFEYYRKKYKLKNTSLSGSLKAEGNYGRTTTKNGKTVIKYNKTMDPDVIAGSIRHEVEHELDKIAGFKGVDRATKKTYKNVNELYTDPKHHKYYDFFEPGYLRRQAVKDAINAGEEVPQTIIKELGLEGYKPQKPVTITGTGLPGQQKVSKFRETVKTGEGTTPEYKKVLERGKPVEYEAAVNAESWATAIDNVNKSPEDTWSKVRTRTEKTMNDQDSAEMMALIEHHEASKNYDAANEVLEHLTRKGTEHGQFIQALSIWNRRTPAGMLRYAKYKVSKAEPIAKKTATISKKQEQIKQLRATIKELEAKKKGKSGKELKKLDDEIELNSKILTGKEKDISQIEAKIAKADLKTEDTAFLSERMTNFKDEAYWQNHYDAKLHKLAKGKIPTEKMKYKASIFATRKKDIELRRALTRVADLEPMGPRERLRAIQRINLLTNARTVVRNNVSNALFGITDVLIRENTIAPVIDYIGAIARTKSLIKPYTMPAASGRTTIIAPFTKGSAYLKGLTKGGMDLMKDLVESARLNEYVNTAETKGMFDAPRGKTFKGTNPLSSLLNKMDNVVKTIVTDRPFYEAAKASRLAELKKIMKTSTVTTEMDANSALYALDKVFQNDSHISTRMTQVRKVLPGSEILMPFTQTPGNILDKLLDYSGVGVIKFVRQFGQRKTQGFDSKLAVDRLSRTFSGAALAGIAYVLAKKGIITGNLYNEPSSKIRAYVQAKGKKSYSFIMGGKYYSYDWTTPLGGIFSATADLMQVEGEGKALQAIEAFTAAPLNTVLNQSFMSNLFSLFQSRDVGKNVLTTGAASLSHIVPLSTLMRQFGTTFDPVDRETYDESSIKKGLNRVQKGLPYFRTKLEPKIDVFGQAKSYKTGDSVSDFMQTFIVPFNISKEKSTAITTELDRLIENNPNEKATSVLPSVVSDTITHKGEDFELTKPQHTKYKKVYGDLAVNKISTLMFSQEYKKAANADKYKMMKSTYREISSEAKIKALKNFGYKIEDDD